jgi:hypothetical protein
VPAAALQSVAGTSTRGCVVGNAAADEIARARFLHLAVDELLLRQFSRRIARERRGDSESRCSRTSFETTRPPDHEVALARCRSRLATVESHRCLGQGGYSSIPVATSRDRIVPDLRNGGSVVDDVEFAGGHTVDPGTQAQASSAFLGLP